MCCCLYLAASISHQYCAIQTQTTSSCTCLLQTLPNQSWSYLMSTLGSIKLALGHYGRGRRLAEHSPHTIWCSSQWRRWSSSFNLRDLLKLPAHLSHWRFSGRNRFRMCSELISAWRGRTGTPTFGCHCCGQSQKLSSWGRWGPHWNLLSSEFRCSLWSMVFQKKRSTWR